MPLFDRTQSTATSVDRNVEYVFDAFIAGINSLSGFTITMVDRPRYTITASVRMSMLTWGENVTINLVPTGPARTDIYVNSNSKLGTEIAGGSKNRKNVDKIMQAMASYLR